MANATSHIADQTLWTRLVLGWGKLRRWYLIHFRKKYVEDSLARRRGHCNRSGACCRLMYTCPALRGEGADAKCSVYEWRPKNCSIFPIDERDLSDRDLVMPSKPCGYYFVTEGTVEESQD